MHGKAISLGKRGGDWYVNKCSGKIVDIALRVDRIESVAKSICGGRKGVRVLGARILPKMSEVHS